MAPPIAFLFPGQGSQFAGMGKALAGTDAAARRIFGCQRLDGFGFDVEVLYIARRLGYRTVEVPVRWNDAPGTKVSMLLGAKGFLDTLKVRWNGLTGKYR